MLGGSSLCEGMEEGHCMQFYPSKGKEVVSRFESIGKNPSPTLARDKANIKYLSRRQPSPYELALGVELGPNPHSKRTHDQPVTKTQFYRCARTRPHKHDLNP
ncbi:hypothetical protein GmHk_08G023516 [Glycine max]|nr:hypothetical protein GmHk_08G023516 [Glycine max]